MDDNYTFDQIWPLSALSTILEESDKDFLKNLASKLPGPDAYHLLGYLNGFFIDNNGSLEYGLEILKKLPLDDPENFFKTVTAAFIKAKLF